MTGPYNYYYFLFGVPPGKYHRFGTVELKCFSLMEHCVKKRKKLLYIQIFKTSQVKSTVRLVYNDHLRETSKQQALYSDGRYSEVVVNLCFTITIDFAVKMCTCCNTMCFPTRMPVKRFIGLSLLIINLEFKYKRKIHVLVEQSLFLTRSVLGQTSDSQPFLISGTLHNRINCEAHLLNYKILKKKLKRNSSHIIVHPNIFMLSTEPNVIG